MPRVSVGLPVFNGERFFEETLDSLLTQTFEDFELIISDNASTDRTQEICQAYAARDRRIRYYRNGQNRGATWNFNHVFELSTGEYFRWAAHDDLCAPELLERCVELLDTDISAVLSYCKTRLIDEHGKMVRNLVVNSNVRSSKPYKRFLSSVFSPPQIQVFGLIRSKILEKTRLIGNYSSSDRTLAAELALLGRFCEIPEYLFFYRRHTGQSTGSEYPTRHARESWYDPTRTGKITFPHWRLLREHLISIRRVPLNCFDRMLCHLYLCRWIIRVRRDLAKNLILKEHNLPQADPHKPVCKLSV